LYNRKKQEVKDPNSPFFDTELTKQTLQFLAITIISTRNWAKHFDNIKANASRRMGILRCGNSFLPKLALTIHYKSCVHSALEYAAAVWHGAAKYHLNKIDSVKNKALKKLLYLMIRL
jgi:hypothetical protein